MQNKKKDARGRQNAERKRKYRRIRGAAITVIALIYLGIVGAAAVFIDDRHIEITLFGDEDMNAEVCESFSDPGAEAFFTGNLFGRTEKPVELRVESDVDSSRIGDYTIKYSAEAYGVSAESYRRVHVRATTPPVISILHEEGYLASWLVGYKEEGYTALDNYDGDLTDKVVRTETEDRVIYTVTDSSGNER